MKDLIYRQGAINAIENTECELLPEEWDELTKAIKQVPSAEPWSAIKTLLNELEQKEEKLWADYCDATARLKAISKIAESSQKPNQKIEGIKPLAEPYKGGDAE